MNSANETIKRLHDLDTEYALKKRDAMKSIIEARHALREKSTSRNEAEEALQNAQDSYSLLNLEHQAERSRIWADLDRSDDGISAPDILRSSDEKPDGVYFIFEGGASLLYKSLDGKQGTAPDDKALSQTVHYIGIKMGQTKIAVSLGEEEGTLVKEGTSGEPLFKTSNWEEARLARLDGKEDTQQIVAQGTDIELNPGEYIPSLFELNVIYLWRKYVDEALDIVEGELLKDDWYWSSTSYSATSAWGLFFSNGYQDSNSKSTSRGRVRPVSAFAW